MTDIEKQLYLNDSQNTKIQEGGRADLVVEEK